jgi:hypothetical protein
MIRGSEEERMIIIGIEQLNAKLNLPQLAARKRR